MGDKKPSVRTLKSGEQVVHHPGGKQILVPPDVVRSRLEGLQATGKWLQVENRDDSELVARREEMIAKGVPSDKRPI